MYKNGQLITIKGNNIKFICRIRTTSLSLCFNCKNSKQCIILGFYSPIREWCFKHLECNQYLQTLKAYPM